MNVKQIRARVKRLEGDGLLDTLAAYQDWNPVYRAL
jgi:hypothetical protein